MRVRIREMKMKAIAIISVLKGKPTRYKTKAGIVIHDTPKAEIFFDNDKMVVSVSKKQLLITGNTIVSCEGAAILIKSSGALEPGNA